jgi:tetratricopeptide (TPR) repeat protein
VKKIILFHERIDRMTLDAIKNRTVRIAIVDSTGEIGTHVAAALKRLGFSWFAPTFRSFAEFQLYSRRHEVGWLITTLCEHSNLDALKFAQQMDDAKMFWSLILTSEQVAPNIQAAYSLGLLSWHPWAGNGDVFEREFKDLIARIPSDLSDQDVAASYLREYLVKEKNWEELVSFEEALVPHMNETGEQLVNLFKAYLNARKQDKYDETLSLIKHLAPAKYNDCFALYKKFYPDYAPAPFNKRYCLEESIVLASPAGQDAVPAIHKAGFKQVFSFTDFASATAHLKDHVGKTSLIFLEWDAKIQASLFLHRVRSLTRREIPIIVVGNKFKPQDLELFKDFNVAQVMRNPLSEQKLIMAVAWAIVQQHEPSEIRTIENKIINYYRDGQAHYGNTLKARFAGLSYVSPTRLAYVEAVELYAAGEHKKALGRLLEACEGADKPVGYIWEFISHLYFITKSYNQAIDWLRQSCKASPANHHRLAQLAVKLIILGELKEAEQIIETLTEWDAGNPSAVYAQGCLTFASGFIEKLPSRDLIGLIAPVVNDAAVRLVEEGEVAKGVDLWKKLLSHSGSQNVQIQSTLSFNLALTLYKIGSFQLAKLYAKNAVQAGGMTSVSAQELLDNLDEVRHTDVKRLGLIFLDTASPFGITGNAPTANVKTLRCLAGIYVSPNRKPASQAS